MQLTSPDTGGTHVLKNAHLAIGGLTFVAFCWSGLYLRYTAESVYLGDHVSRMMFVANHIYILMAALANIAVGRYVTPLKNPIGKTLQTLGLGLMMAGSIVLVYAFTIEPMLGSMERPRSYFGVIALAAGVLAHGLSGFEIRTKSGS